MGGSMAEHIGVGLIADPGLPLSLARRLKNELAAALQGKLDDSVSWVIDVEELSLPLSRDGEVILNKNAQSIRTDHGWKYLVYLTDLPKYEHGEPLTSSINVANGAATIVIPALGLVRKNRLMRALVRVLAALHGARNPLEVSGKQIDASTKLLSTERSVLGDSPQDDTVDTITGIRGRIFLLVGMVRSNRPWRLVPGLSTSMAAALATGAFGVFYTSIWSMADYLSPARLLLISLLSVLVLASWLLLHNHLWERPTGGRRREKYVIYNLATALTIFLASAVMYILLFATLLLGATIIIDAQYLGMELGHEITFMNYLNLAWLAASLGTIGGAVGSSLDDEDSVRRATFSHREYERRKINLGPATHTDP